MNALILSFARRMFRCAASFALIVLVIPLVAQETAPEPVPITLSADCQSIQQMITDGTTPFSAADALGGGELAPRVPAQGDFPAGRVAEVWALNIQRAGTTGTLDFTVSFPQISGTAALEYAIFDGMAPLTAYAPLNSGAAVSLRAPGDGVYSVVVRRDRTATPGKNADTTNTGAYQIVAEFEGGAPLSVSALRDETAGTAGVTPGIVGGHVAIPVNRATFIAHPRAITSIASRSGQSSQVFFGTDSLLVNLWAQEVVLIGGDLAITGEADGRARTLYVENYGHAFSQLDGDLANVTDSNGTRWRLDWSLMDGVWIGTDCAGFKLRDGRAFIGALEATRTRYVEFTGSQDAFTLGLSAPGGDQSATLTWAGIVAPFTTWLEGVFRTEYPDGRSLALEESRFTLTQEIDSTLSVRMDTRNAQLLTDWREISALSLIADAVTITYNDGVRTTTTRPAEGLRLFEALDGITRIDYDPTETNPVDEILLLGADESFIELITPGSPPTYNPQALPNESGYSPRALNNLGAECYPINTLQPEANCPPNGELNPANGNLWYAVTDLIAYGGMIDLSLTRSYNSLQAGVDSPFGRGWESPFRLDYAVTYDAERNSRPISTESVADFPVGLDLTYAPQGLVTFRTPSGSQHLFVGANPFTAGTLTAVTMPDWTLTRPSIRDGWTLDAGDGLIYSFDRAGRLKSYGYPAGERLIRIDYAGTFLDGPAALDSAVTISDSAEDRRLELRFDGVHVSRAVLRAADSGAEGACADAETLCFQTDYRYDEGGHLVGVDYHDGSAATYTYDAQGRMITVDDPRAPILTSFSVVYNTSGNGVAIATPEGQAVQSLSASSVGNETLSRTLTDAKGAAQTFTYAYPASGSLRDVGTAFTRLAQTSPLAGASEFDSLPISYEWTDGYLTDILTRSARGLGRNNTLFDIRDGQLNRVWSAQPSTQIRYDELGRVTQVSYPDGTEESFTYDGAGLVTTVTTRAGATLTLSYDTQNRMQTVTDAANGTATTYGYDSLGLVTSVTESLLVGEDPGSTVDYRYDAFGRLVAVDDPLTGGYTLTYSADPDAETLTLTDATDTVTATTVTHAGQVLREQVTDADGAILRETAYSYDALRRLTAITRRVDAETVYTTTMTYTAAPTLPPLGDDTAETLINGMTESHFDAYGRMETITYDALNRVREIRAANGEITRYDYLPESEGTNTLGWLVRERHALNGLVTDTREYRFDLTWQLREVSDGALRWFFRLDPNVANGNQYSAIENESRLLLDSVVYADYLGGRPTRADINARVPADLPSDTRSPEMLIRTQTDSQGRPTSYTDGNGTTYPVLSCPQAGGALRTVYALPDAAPESINCEMMDVLRVVTTDAAGRIIEVTDASGTRTITLTPEAGAWRVAVHFTGIGGEKAQWELVYNGVGDLLAWTDADGVLREYTYDNLGRLLRVSVADQPEASWTYVYNAADLLTSALDDAGRGTRYDYDALGRLIVQQDARNANATVYGYNPAGLLSTVISPLGNTTNYRYEDESDPRRLTGIITPTGATYRIAWDDRANTLTVTGSRGEQTVYSFDTFGALWRIQDALGRVHELRYDATGRLSAWRQTQTANSAAESLDIAYPSATDMQIIGEGFTRNFSTTPDGALTAVDDLNLRYDALGRLVAATLGQDSWSLTHASGAVTLTMDDGRVIALSYDALNRLTRESLDGAETTITYTVERGGDVRATVSGGETYALTTAPGDATSNAPSVQVRTDGTLTTYAQDAEGLLAEITAETCLTVDEVSVLDDDRCTRADTVWRVTERLRYDSAGRPIRRIDAGQNIETFAYDDAGNLVVYQDVDGRTFNYSYDLLNRLTSLTGPTGIRLFLDYDAGDNVIGVCRVRADQASDYDGCTENGTVLETYTYDAQGRLTLRTVPGADILTAFSYGADGLLASWGLPSGSQTVLQRQGLEQSRVIDGNTTRLVLLPGADRFRTEIIGDLQIEYDALDRVVAMASDAGAFTYAYNEDGLTITAPDDSTLTYTVDSRDLLVGISDQLSMDYFLSPDGQVLVTDATRGDGQVVQIQRGAVGDVQSIGYFDSNLLIDTTANAGGSLQRQSIIGAAEYFVTGTQDYIVVIGYDNDGRPLTLRISDRANGARLYLLTITYSTLGLRETESRQYADGTQVTMTYRYNAADQLVSHTRQTDRPASDPLPDTGQASALIGMVGVAFLSRNRRARRGLYAAFGAAMLLGVVSWINLAQTTSPQTLVTMRFEYDARGNLTRVIDRETTCKTYTYDSANRLIGVTQGERTTDYSYDGLNRLASIDDLQMVYQGDTDAILATVNKAGVRWYGGTESLPAFFQMAGESVWWMLHDGRWQTLAITDDAGTTSPVWMFDPLGRYLSLDAPPVDDNPCAEIVPPAELSARAPVPGLRDGMIYDPTTGLHFHDGRAYSAELGVYLGRDPLGVDGFGAAYSYPARDHELPIRQREPAFMDGLTALADATDAMTQAMPVTAAAVLSAHQPAPNSPRLDHPAQGIAALAAQTRAQQTALADLPAWLNATVNLAPLTRDADGFLRLSTPAAPGLTPNSAFTPTRTGADRFSATLPTIAAPTERLSALNAGARPFVATTHSYDAQAWLPARPAADGLWSALNGEIARPPLDDLWDYMPAALRNPAAQALALQTVRDLYAAIQTDTAAWLQRALIAATPTRPQVPPQDTRAALSAWFSADPLGLSEILRAANRFDVPDLPLPVYDFGVNARPFAWGE